MSSSSASPASAVLLSTFNGMKFIEAQIASLRQQSSALVLYVRDDGSTDGTREYLQSLRAEKAFTVKLIEDADHLGPSQSFSRLLELAEAHSHYFFCDQDDIWHPQKIEVFEKTFQKFASDSGPGPRALYSDARLIDDEGRLLHSSLKEKMGHRQRIPTWNYLIVQNYVTGCTLALNHPLRLLVGAIPKPAIMHDHWIALVATALGSLDYLEKPLIDYRQHGQNATGGAKRHRLFGKIFRTLQDTSSDQKLMRLRFNQARAFEEFLQQQSSTPEIFRALEELNLAWQKGGVSALKSSLKFGLRGQDFLRTALFNLLILKAQSDQNTA